MSYEVKGEVERTKEKLLKQEPIVECFESLILERSFCLLSAGIN